MGEISPSRNVLPVISQVHPLLFMANSLNHTFIEDKIKAEEGASSILDTA